MSDVAALIAAQDAPVAKRGPYRKKPAWGGDVQARTRADSCWGGSSREADAKVILAAALLARNQARRTPIPAALQEARSPVALRGSCQLHFAEMDRLLGQVHGQTKPKAEAAQSSAKF